MRRNPIWKTDLRQTIISSPKQKLQGFAPLGVLALVMVLSLVLLLMPNLSPTFQPARTMAPASVFAPGPSSAQQVYGRLPLYFEVNQGQHDAQVRFLARGKGYHLFLTDAEAVWSLFTRPSRREREISSDSSTGSATRPSPAEEKDVLRLSWSGANPHPETVGLEKQIGKANYFKGNDPTQWRRDVSLYQKVKYAAIYPGVDLVFYGQERQLEFDFVVAPGADPTVIELTLEGAKTLQLDSCGNLLIGMEYGDLCLKKPGVYQEIDGVHREIPGRYVIQDGMRVRFAVAPYDPTHPLVIDPTVVYSTYLGGSNADGADGIAVDGARDAYVAGYTNSADFPVQGPFQGDQAGGDVFVTKFSINGNGLIYSTYLGGNNGESADDIALNSSNEAYIVGSTDSTDFPLVNPFQNDQPSTDAFVTRLNANGNGLIYSTYLGGNNFEVAYDVAVDSANQAYVTGETTSTDFPLLNQYQGDQPGTDAFVTKLAAAGSSLVYSTYLGGNLNDRGYGIALDGSNQAYITGETDSTDFPLLNQYQGDQTGTDAFVTKFTAAGSSLVYSTYLGGNSTENGKSIAVNSSNQAYVTGFTDSTDFPLLNQYQGDQSTTDAFVTKFDVSGSSLIYSTYLGGSNTEKGRGITVNGAGNALIIGETNSIDFPLQNQTQGDQPSTDAFVTKLAVNGSSLAFSTYLGGDSSDFGYGIALDNSGNAYVAGETSSTNFPTQNPFQGDQGGNDAFVTKFSLAPEMDVQGLGVSIADGDTTPTTSDDTDFGNVNVSGGTAEHTFTIKNTGGDALNLTASPRVKITGSHASDFTVTLQPTSPVAESGSTTFKVQFDPSASGTRSATITIDNDDGDENPYDFAIQGSGQASVPLLLGWRMILATLLLMAMAMGWMAKKVESKQ